MMDLFIGKCIFYANILMEVEFIPTLQPLVREIIVTDIGETCNSLGKYKE